MNRMHMVTGWLLAALVATPAMPTISFEPLFFTTPTSSAGTFQIANSGSPATATALTAPLSQLRALGGGGISGTDRTGEQILRRRRLGERATRSRAPLVSRGAGILVAEPQAEGSAPAVAA